jgi:nitroreductase
MDSFAKLALNRRSVRQYTGESLLPEAVEQIMKTALTAPSAKNSRPCQFVLVEDKETLKKLSACKPTGAAFVAHCALAVVVLSDCLKSTAYLQDASIASTYIQLQAEDLGLGSCWVQVIGRETESGYDSEQYIRDLLDIPLQLAVACIVAIGHKANVPEPHNEAGLLWEKLHIEKFSDGNPKE